MAAKYKEFLVANGDAMSWKRTQIDLYVKLMATI